VCSVIGVACLLALLLTAHRHPRPTTEALIALLTVVAVLGTGYLSPAHAWDALRPLLPVVGFLLAILVVAEVCARAGLFTAAAEVVRRHSRSDAHRLFLGVFVVAALVTTALSLDATVILLTPVVVGAARAMGTSGRPGAYTCLRLANSGSLLLPVSNLTNLLAMPYLGLGFLGFAGRMALPLVIVLLVEYAGLRLIFRNDLVGLEARSARTSTTGTGPARTSTTGTGPARTSTTDTQDGPGAPRRVLVPAATVALMLVAFAALSPFGIEPWVPATAAAVVLVGWGARERLVHPVAAVRAAHPSFALWVLALGVVVAGLSRDFLGGLVDRLIPGGTGYGDLLLIAVLATLASAIVANLSATLLLVPPLAPLGDTAVLAGLLGLTIGAGLTWTGSLANLLWRRTLARDGIAPSSGRFHLVSLTLTPIALVSAVAALMLTK